MLKTIRDACQPHPMALEYSMGDQIEDLATVIAGEGDGSAFFEKTYPTAGMRKLFDEGLGRLGGRSDQALFELSQAMGGGKTHLMIALGLLAKHPALRARVVPELSARTNFGAARVVAITGRNYPDHFLWGEIAQQLGKAAEFARYWQNGPAAPDETAWLQLIGETPTLILLDELPPYFDYAVTRPVGGGTLAQVATAALANLFAAALKLPRLCIVVSNLSGAYEGASQDLRRAMRNIEQEARRQARRITPVELGSDEIYQILKKRLFTTLPPPADVDRVVDAFAQQIAEAEKSKSIAKSTEQIQAEIRGSYPFHPAIKDVIALFRNNESYRQTRGLMQFVSKMVRSVWKRPTNDVHLIGLQHLDLNDPEVREEVVRISDLQNAIAHDIAAAGAAVAETIDADLTSDAGSQVATLLLCSSLSTAVDAVKGLTRQRLLEFLIAPNRSVHEFADAFEHLRRDAWYLHKDRSEAYYFSNVENVTKRLTTEAERAPQPKVDTEMRRRLELIFEPKRKRAYQVLKALPTIDEVDLKGPRVLLVLSPDTQNPPAEAKRFHEHVVEKNNVGILTGDGTDISNLEEKTRMVWAIAKVDAELPDSHPLKADLAEKAETAEQEFNATVTSLFNRVWFPTKSGLTFATLRLEFQGNAFDGEEQIEKALSAVSASKLYLDLEGANATTLIARAEDVIWPENQKRVPWRDVRQRALTTPRWPWLPAGGLDKLREIAESRGAWRYTADGYIEKGPFEKPKTSVSVLERAYDEKTGRATLELTALNAGAAPEIHYGPEPSVSAASPRLGDSKLETDETRLWFIAVDPKGEHETGAPIAWSNRLTITHQPRDGVGRRTVELKVAPRGTIRYTLTGANPAEGTEYKAPIEIGSEETVIYCYAVHNDVSAKRTFNVPPAGNKGVRIDDNQPARLKKRIECGGTAESFELLKKLREMRARLLVRSLEVGQGARNVSIRPGTDVVFTPDTLEQLIAAARAAVALDQAEIVLTVNVIEFLTGKDLKEFVHDRNIEISPDEVEQ